MNALGRELAQLIRAQGPITVSQYMAEALSHPIYGYYMTRDPIGADSDFITAPEISQTFGELIGLWASTVWQTLGAPKPINLVELGPGRGTLMADALRAISLIPEFRDSINLQLVEISPTLRAIQSKTLSGESPKWQNSFSDVPDGPLIVVANELFDALPIRQFQRSTEGWHERLIGLNPKGDQFCYVLSPPIPPEGLVPDKLLQSPLNSTIEICLPGKILAEGIATRIQRWSGAALFIDCGAAYSEPRDTLQAVQKHQRHPLLETPGEADIAAHVDFEALALSITNAGADVHGPVEQGVFLNRLGIRERLRVLEKTHDRSQRNNIREGVERLTDSGQMGSLFKVLCVVPRNAPTPTGFEAL